LQKIIGFVHFRTVAHMVSYGTVHCCYICSIRNYLYTAHL